MKKLDLHGVRHEYVRNEVIRFVEAYWNTDEIELDIITGYSVPMQRIVGEVLDEYQLDYRVGNGLLIDRGFIRVTMP